jgi:transcriptional regulator with XRE-family HTH domain
MQGGENMSVEEFNAIFSKRLRYYLNKYGMTQLELSKRLGVGTTSVYNWCNGIKTPRMDKVDSMCKIFNCKRSDLIEDKADEEEQPAYYFDEEAREAADFLHKNPEYKVLFDASRNISKEDIEFVAKMLDKFRK